MKAIESKTIAEINNNAEYHTTSKFTEIKTVEGAAIFIPIKCMKSSGVDCWTGYYIKI